MRPTGSQGPAWLRRSALGVAALVLAPVAALLMIALSGDTETLAHVAGTVLPTALRQTAILVGGVALVAAVIGVGTAWLVSAYHFPGRAGLQVALMLPMAVPTYIVAYVAVELLEPLGPIQGALRALTGWRSRADYWFPEVRSLPGAILVMALVLFPYVYMTARALFQVQSANLIEVARTLGSSRWHLFTRVVLPLARPAVILGVTLVSLETLNDIGASEYLGVRTLSVAIFTTWLNRGSLAGAAQIALLMLVAVAVLVALERHARGQRIYTISVKRPRPPQRIRLTGWAAAAATLACALPVILGFAIPVSYLLHEAVLRTLRRGIDPDFLAQIRATLALAALATAIVVGLGALVATAARLCRGRWMAGAARAASLGYALPGTVLAVGLLFPLAAADNAIANAWRASTGTSPGLLLTGSGAAVVIAYVIRFVGIAAGGIETGLARIAPQIDDAARTLGRRPMAIVREVHWPLGRPAVVSAALLVFVDAMKELPATLLLRPLNLDTLATGLYAHAAGGRFEDGALAAVTIVAAGLVPVVLMMRLGQAGPTEPPPSNRQSPAVRRRPETVSDRRRRCP